MAREVRAELEWPSRSKVHKSVSKNKAGVIKVSEKNKPKIGKKAQLLAAGALTVGGLAVRGGVDTYEDIKEGVGDVSAKVQRILGQEDQEAAPEELQIKIQRSETQFNVVYGDLTPLENSAAFDQILEQEKIIQEHYLDREHMVMVKFHEQLIRQSARAEGVPEDLLFGLVIIESKGDQYAESPVGARGLTQMMPQMAEKYGLEVSEFGNDERYIPEKILPATAKELKESYNRWGDWGLALWEWHAGAPEIYGAVQVYLRDIYGEELPDVNVEDPQEALRIKDLYKDRIMIRQVNVFRLFQNPLIRAEFSGPEWDLTSIYVPRAVAASIVYRANENLIASR